MKEFTAKPNNSGFVEGVEQVRLNQLLADFDVEEFLAKQAKVEMTASEWVVEGCKGELIGSYDSEDAAMDAAIARFGDVLMILSQTDDEPRIVITPAFVDAQGNAYTPKNVPSLISPYSAGGGPLPEIEYIRVERDGVVLDADD